MEHSSFDNLYLSSFLCPHLLFATPSFPFFCICCSYRLNFIISLFCSLDYSLHFLFFFINALSSIGSLFILSSSFFNGFSCILSFFCYMLFLYPVSFSFDLSHICLRIQFYFLLFFIYLPTYFCFSLFNSLSYYVFLCII